MVRPVSEILSDALASFEGGKRWTRGAWYKEGSYYSSGYVPPAKEADTFCSLGAIHRSMVLHGECEDLGACCAKGINVTRVMKPVMDVLLTHLQGKAIHSFNDYAPNFTPIKEAFCSAIKTQLEVESKEESCQPKS